VPQVVSAVSNDKVSITHRIKEQNSLPEGYMWAAPKSLSETRLCADQLHCPESKQGCTHDGLHQEHPPTSWHETSINLTFCIFFEH
jgi:hypothetical protein